MSRIDYVIYMVGLWESCALIAHTLISLWLTGGFSFATEIGYGLCLAVFPLGVFLGLLSYRVTPDVRCGYCGQSSEHK